MIDVYVNYYVYYTFMLYDKRILFIISVFIIIKYFRDFFLIKKEIK